MSFDAHQNFAYSLVASAPSPATSGTSLTVTSGQGVLFPSPPFNAVVWPSGVQPLTTNAEIVRVTAISTDTFTITRNTSTENQNSYNRSIQVGDQIAEAITWKMITDIEYPNNVTSGVSSVLPAGRGVYITDYMEITNGDTYEIASGGVLEIG